VHSATRMENFLSDSRLFSNTQISITIIRNGNISLILFLVHIVTLAKLTLIEANFLLDVNHLIYYCTS
jgi:hypothetical protein